MHERLTVPSASLCDLRILFRDILFRHKLHRRRSPDACQSCCARAPSESCAHFNVYWNVIKTTQSDSRQSMLFRLCAAEAGLSAPACIVCLHAIHAHPPEETMGESHLLNSCLKGEFGLRLPADWRQCSLIDTGHSLHMGETHGGTVTDREHRVAHKVCPAGFLYFSNNTIVCQQPTISPHAA